MRLILNILWFLFGGFVSGTAWLLAGAIFAITIVGLPWAPAAFRLAGYSYAPFGKRLVETHTGFGSTLLNILWFVLAGWWLAIHHVVLAVGLAVTIVGIPFAWQHLKLAMASLTPVGRAVALA